MMPLEDINDALRNESDLEKNTNNSYKRKKEERRKETRDKRKRKVRGDGLTMGGAKVKLKISFLPLFGADSCAGGPPEQNQTLNIE